MAFEYEIELKSKSGDHIENLKKDCVSVTWRYDALGGCGDCEIVLRRDFDSYGDIGLDYGIEIHEIVAIDTSDILGGAFPLTIDEALFGGGTPGGSALPAQLPFQLIGTKTIRYAGFIRRIVPELSIPEQVRLEVSGYSRQLEYISVTKKTAPLGPITYASMDVGEIARQIIDTYVLPSTKIMRSPTENLCQNTGIVVSSTGLSFNTSAWEALKTLAEIGGNCEFGVTANKQIFFVPRSTTVKQTWTIGGYIEFLQPSVGSTDEIVHTVYLEGGLVAGSPFRAILNLATPDSGFVKERNVSVSAITNADDATLWGVGYASRFSSAQSGGRVRLAAIDIELSGVSNFIEHQPNQTMPPLGLFRVLGAPTFLRAGAALPFQLPVQILTASAGGTTDVSFRINSIGYTPIDGGLAVDVELGERSSRLSDLFRAIDYKISDLRQRAA